MERNGSTFSDWTESHVWFRTNYARLARKHDHQNVAVYKRKVVDRDRTLARLLGRVTKTYPRDRIVVVYVTRQKRVLIDVERVRS